MAGRARRKDFTRTGLGRPVRAVGAVGLVLGAIAAGTASAQVDETCTASVLNRTGRARADGSLFIRNIPVDRAVHRVRVVCTRPDGTTDAGQSAFLGLRAGRTVEIPGLDLEAVEPIPTSLEIVGPAAPLTQAGQRAALEVTCRLPDGSSTRCTDPASGTTYRTSNASVCDVDAGGRVTAGTSGTCLVTAVNEGVLATVQIAIAVGDDADGDGLPNDFESRTLCLDPTVGDAGGDPDGDTLTSLEELGLGSDPCLADTDSDGLGDADEIARGLNPADPDADRDGLVDGDEVALGSDPRDPDTDGDGLADGFESRLSPCVSLRSVDTDGDQIPDAEEDCDRDGLLNGDELALFSDPGNPDSDADGLRDGFEVASGFDLLAPGEENQDPDGDGVDNLAEQAALTDPLDPDTDGDGLSDGDELSVHGTSPISADTDGDGLSDGQEVGVHGTDPNVEDTDGGGRTDGEEVLLDGTDPLDPTDDPQPDRGIPLTDGTVRVDQPVVGVDGAGNIHVAWQDQRTGNAEIFYKMLSPDGQTEIISDTQLTDDPSRSERPALAVDGGGRVHVVWQRLSRIFYTLLDPALRPGPVTIVEDVAISADDGQRGLLPSVALDGADRAHVVWSGSNAGTVHYARIGADGAIELLDRLVYRGDRNARKKANMLPGVAVDGRMRVHVVWSQEAETAAAEIFYAMLDGHSGAPRIAPSRVTEDDGRRSRFPSVAAGPGDEVTLVFHDLRFGGCCTPVFMRRLDPGRDDQDGDAMDVEGVTVLDDTQIAPTTGTARRNHPTAVVDGEGNLQATYYADWDSGGPGDLRFGKFDSQGIPVLPGLPITASQTATTLDDFTRGALAVDGPTTVLTWLNDDFQSGLPQARIRLRILAVDTDRDGLSDVEERRLGLDATQPDGDGDGLRDGFEVRNGFDPGLAGEAGLDPDGDGLDNFAEQAAGSDPNAADTDGDGLDDGAEVSTHGSDPRLPDTDGDGLEDADEVGVHGTSPTLSDTDGDGLFDGFEVTNGLDAMLPGQESDDADADGLDALREQGLGTSPNAADTDGDGLDDGAEVSVHGTAPANADTDDDGLPDGVEVSLAPCVDPLTFDTDGDRRAFGGDGADAAEDCDGDQLPNGEEVNVAGTDPGNPDSDGDGATDGVEVARGCQPTLSELTAVTGTVRDPGGAPIAGAAVRSLGQAATSDAAGAFRIEGVGACVPREVRVVADAGGPGNRLRGISTASVPVVNGVTDVGEIVVEARAVGTLYPGEKFFTADSTEAEPVAVGDVNGDGLPDLLTANRVPSELRVLFGQGGGGFSAPSVLPAGDEPVALGLGDLDGDTNLDVVLANHATDDVSILLGNGDGSFQAEARVPAGDGPIALVVAPIDNDATLDLAVATDVSKSITVLLGSGDGGFTATDGAFLGNLEPTELAIADVTGDGTADLLMVQSRFDRLTVRVGDGTGAFAPGPEFRIAGQPGALAVADLNADGLLDVVASGPGRSAPAVPGGVSVVLGAASGGLEAEARLFPGVGSAGLVLLDLDLDGNPDLVGSDGQQNLSLARGNGDGSFQDRRLLRVTGRPKKLTAADLDLDGIPDLAVSTPSGQAIAVLLGRGDGSFEGEERAPLGHIADSVAVADLDGDGRDDVVAVGSSSDVSVRLATAGGGFAPERTFAAGLSPRSVTVGDLNGDSSRDLVVANFNDVSVLLGNGDGTFQNERRLAVGDGLEQVLLANLDGDPSLDLVVVDGGRRFVSAGAVFVLSGLGDGDFGAPQILPLTILVAPVSAAVEDVNRDGKLDVVTGQAAAKDPATAEPIASPNLSVFLGNGDGSFQAERRFESRATATSVALADLDGDGARDLAVAHEETDQVGILLGNGDGTFRGEQLLPAGLSPRAIVARDLDGDGKIDLAVVHGGRVFGDAHDLWVYPGQGDGTFQPPRRFVAGNLPDALEAGDVDGDGALDLVVGSTSALEFSVLHHR